MKSTSETFVLDEGCAAVLTEKASLVERWTEFPHARQRERGLVLLAGERLELPALITPTEPVLWMRCLRGLPEISSDGLDVEVWAMLGTATSQLLFSQRLENAQPDAGVREIVFDLPAVAGSELKLEVRCEAGPEGRPNADWLGLVGLVVAPRGELPLHRARAHHAWRLENEIAHFSSVYSGEFYRDRQLSRGASAASIRPLRSLSSCAAQGDSRNEQLHVALRTRLRDIEPTPAEHAFGYAHRMLGTLVPDQAPDFAARLRAMSANRPGRPLRMLALCAGEAAIEGGLLAAAAVPVDLCIVDVNEGLLEQASLRMPEGVTVDRVLGDANKICPELGTFDIVNITSGLHHLVELERVLGVISEILLPGGEFWLIGEQVGRNGNQLWPEAISAAERVFASWPAEKRRNRNTGTLDESLPNVDFSTACFEGVRSQDINDQLGRYFLPVNCYLRNAFLWRLVDVAYSANFDLANLSDRELLADAVVEEVMHWAHGGRGTEMHAVFRSKLTGLAELAQS